MQKNKWFRKGRGCLGRFRLWEDGKIPGGEQGGFFRLEKKEGGEGKKKKSERIGGKRKDKR